MELRDAIETLTRAGAVFCLPTDKHLSIAEAASRLDCSEDWLRKHKSEFPNLWRMPGGELRFPVADIEGLAKRNRLRRVK